MRLEELLRNLDLGWVADTQEDDRNIAGDAMTPESTLSAPILTQHAGGSTSGGIGVNQSAGQLRVDLDLGFRGTQFARGCIGPGEIKGAVDHTGILKFFDQGKCGVSGFRHTQYEIDADSLIWSQSEGAPERNDRVENGTHRVGKRRSILHCYRVSRL